MIKIEVKYTVIIFLLNTCCVYCQSNRELSKRLDSLDIKLRKAEIKVIELEMRPKFDPTDTDGDGVIDMFDQEPNTPVGARVDTHGIALDSDGDGIPDYKDKEPFSPPGYKVDTNGVALVPKPAHVTEADVDRIVDAKLSKFKITFEPTTKSAAQGEYFEAGIFPLDSCPSPVQNAKIPSSFFKDIKIKKMKDAAQKIEDGTKTAGYPGPFRYFDLPQGFYGFALILAPELLSDINGNILKPDRLWTSNLKANTYSGWSDWFKSFICPSDGYYRIIVFCIYNSEKAIYYSNSNKDDDEIVIPLSDKRGFDSVNNDIKVDQNKTTGLVLVYEFKVSQYNEKKGRGNVKIIESKKNVEDHLRLAQFWDVIAK